MAAAAWVEEKVRQDKLQIKKHMLARAQTGAMSRAIKSIGMRETYTAEELQHPFVFPKLVFEPDPNFFITNNFSPGAFQRLH